MNRTPFMVLLLLIGCTSAPPRIYTINGVTEVHTTKEFLGIPCATDVKQYKTKAQELDDLEVRRLSIKVDEEEEKKDIKVKRQKTASFYGNVCLAAAIVLALVAVATKGYAFWGALSVASGVLCCLCWAFVEWIDYLKWGGIPIGILSIMKILHLLKDFSVKDWWKKRKEKKNA